MEIINYTKAKLPKKFILNWIKEIQNELLKRKIIKNEFEVTIVFVSKAKIKKLNFLYRNKNKPTDVLSFESGEGLGELVLCLDVLKVQAKIHKLKLNHEIGYMILHGVLHLLGYDHEKSKKDEKIMFELQDSIFYKLLRQ